jgi:hypothetical protein
MTARSLWAPLIRWAPLGAVLATCPFARAEGATSTTWSGGDGQWTQATNWSDGLPDPEREAVVLGASQLVVRAGDYFAGDLELGLNRGDRVRVEVDGGRLILQQDSLRLGEYTGSQAEFILKAGALHCAMDVFVGAATATTGRMTKASLTIAGGSFVGRTLSVGEGLGAESQVAVVGSAPVAVHALDYVYILAAADPSGRPGQSTLAFTLDEHGVTPITIQSRWDGLRIIHDSASSCRLAITLRAVPPQADIPLVIGHTRIRGTFNGLPEGALIAATYAGRTYTWALTYRGGSSGHNLVLQNRRTDSAAAPVTPVRPPPEIPTPLWLGHPVYPLAIADGEPAFPGAEGYGAFTPGGRKGQAIVVDNLNDGGPGSLRAAVMTAGPRSVIFHTGGVIVLQSPLVVSEPYLTLDAGNAPAPGILLRREGIVVSTHDVVLRNFRIRIGDDDVRQNGQNIRYAAGDGVYALYFVEGAQNCIADHLSLSWTTNKILSTTKMSDRITVQWCILSESLNLAGHGYASIVGGNRMSWHHNLFAHNQSRSVRFQGSVDADFRNNVVYDWGDKTAYGEFDRLNYVGNYLKPGPSTTQSPRLFHDGSEVVMPAALFLAGNILEGEPKTSANNWRGTGYYLDRATVAASVPFPAPAVKTEPAEIAYESVLRGAGAIRPQRDRVDERIVREVRAGTGRIVDSVDQAGGWPVF